MRTFILTILILANSLIHYSQSQDHLLFKGIPIDGSLTEFVGKLEKDGFTLIETSDEYAFLEGDFAAYKNCYVGISTLKQKDLVSKINVIFPNRTTWSALSANYFELKELLIEKYGEPEKAVENFNSNMRLDDDLSKMYEARLNRCNYVSTFDLANGGIVLSIENDEMSGSFVMLVYFDKNNSEIIKQKAKDDL